MLRHVLLTPLLLISACCLAPTATAADGPSRRLPGAQETGEVLLPNQWSLRPVGKQIKLGDFPVNVALHPKEHWAAVLHAGFGEHEIVVVDMKRGAVTSRVSLPQAFYGLCFSPDGRHVYASGGEFEVVHHFDFADGYLSDHQELAVGEPSETHVPAGISTSADGGTLYVACTWGHSVCLMPADAPEKKRHLPLEKDDYPYTTLPSQDGKRLFVSLWGKAAVAVIDLADMQVIARHPTERHPTEMALSPDGSLLYASCANSNQVTVLDVQSGKALEVISSALYPTAPTGSTPNSLGLTPDGKALFIANADNNNVAVFDTSERGRSRSLGFIPVGWYPTSVRFSRFDNRLYVANGKGLSSDSNRGGPNPNVRSPKNLVEYIGGLFRGTLSVIDSPAPADMARYSSEAYKASPLREDLAPVLERPEDNPIPAKLGDPSPIKHCIYIIKENRTYDQVFGDVPEGNGDPSLCIFPDAVTPNHHALARRFVLLDNFYVESEVSADGHEWSMAAYATDFVEKSWPLNYRGGKDKIAYPSEGNFPIAFPKGGYIFDRCKEAGVSYRSYGEFTENGPQPGQPGFTRMESLQGHFDPLFWGWDMSYPDVKRTDRFLEELKGFEERGDLPQFIVLRLPNDHTEGTRPGKPTPTAMVADNDLALGRLVEGVSKSRYWKETAIFVVEDDAQNGSDHVDAHRTVALVISPYCKSGTVDSTLYSTSSMLRTMELILGLEPMSQFDAAAAPMYASFGPEADARPYEHLPAGVDLTAVNRPDAWGAEISAKLDFSKEDAADDLVLNEIIWRSVRGADSPMPPPVRASFVITHREEEEEEEGDDDDGGPESPDQRARKR
jgi:YVTN family beta-propeller protein